MKKFNQIYQNIILELINPGMQTQFHFSELSKLGFKVFFTNHASSHDADRNVTQGNEE